MSDRSFWEKMQINDMLVIDTIRKYGRDTIYFKDKDSKFIWNNYMHANQLGVIKPDDLIGKKMAAKEGFDERTEQEIRSAMGELGEDLPAPEQTPQPKTATNRMSRKMLMTTETIRHHSAVMLSPMPRKAMVNR